MGFLYAMKMNNHLDVIYELTFLLPYLCLNYIQFLCYIFHKHHMQILQNYSGNINLGKKKKKELIIKRFNNQNDNQYNLIINN